MKLEDTMTGTALRMRAASAVPFPSWFTKLAVVAFLAAAFTATWGSMYFVVIQIADVFLFFSLLLIGILLAFGGLRFYVPWWLWVPAGALLLCITVRSFMPISEAFSGPRYQLTDEIPGSVAKAAVWVLALVGVPIAAIACSALESRAPKWIIAAFLAGVAFSSLIALTDLAGVTHVSSTLGYESIYLRQTGLTAHPNTLGFACVIAAPFAVHFLSTFRYRWFGCAALVLLGGGVLASGSRGAQAAFPAAVLIAIVFSPHKNKKRVSGWLGVTTTAAAIVGFLVLNAFARDTLDELLRFGGSGATSSSDSHRMILARQALNDFESFPFFGIGIKHIAEAHSIYLQVVSAGGVVLAAGMLAYWYGALRACLLAKRTGEVLGIFLMISIVMWLILGAIQNQLTDRLLYYTVAGVAALAAAHRDPGGLDPVERRDNHRFVLSGKASEIRA